MSIAFFDFDKTLISVNSGSMWIKSEVKLGFLSWFDALRASAWILRYQLGFTGLDAGVKMIIARLEGSREDVLRQRVIDFYDSHVRPLYRPLAREVIASHRAQGHKLVLITSSSNYMAEAVTQDLGLDDVLCNRFEVNAEGCYTGRPLGEICYGAGKLLLARQYVETRGVELSQCSFYTDSMADLPLLEVVGQPVAVNPDPRLRKVAVQRGWTITDWGLPG